MPPAQALDGCGDALEGFGDAVVVAAGDDHAKRGDEFGEGAEAGHDLVDIFVKVEVIGLDVGDDGDARMQIVEAAVVFAGFGHEDLPLPAAAAPAELGDGSADDEAGVEPAFEERETDHGGGGGFAVGPGDGDAEAFAHDHAEKLGVFDGSDAELPGEGEFAVIVGDGGAADNDVEAAVEKFAGLTRGNFCARRMRSAVWALSLGSEPVTRAPASMSMWASPVMPVPPTPIKWTRFPRKRLAAESFRPEANVASMLFIIVQGGLWTCQTKIGMTRKKL